MEMILSSVFKGRFQKAADSLNVLMQSYPGMDGNHHLLTHLTTLCAHTGEPLIFPVEVILLDSPSQEQTDGLLAFLQLEAGQYTELTEALHEPEQRFTFQARADSGAMTLEYKIHTSAHFPVRNTASIRPIMKIAFWFAEQAPPAEELEPIQLRLASEGGILIHVFRSEVPLLHDMEDLRVLPVPWDPLPATLFKYMQEQKLEESIPLVYGMGLVQGLERISDAFDQFVDQQEKDIRTKKFNAQQDINAVKQDEKLNLRDLFQQLKGNLQRDFTEFERGISDQLQRMSQKYNSQSLMAEVEQQVMQVQQLEEETFAGALRMRIPPGVQEQLQHSIADALRSQIDQDIFSLKEFLKHESSEIQGQLNKHQIEFSYPAQMQINLSRIQVNMQEFLLFKQKYETEKKKLEFTDYTRGALAPILGLGSLFMLATLMGFNLRSLVQNGSQFITIPVLLAICGYSLFKFLRHTKARQQSDYALEINRMREGLISECKGMIRKVSEDWGRELSAAIREEFNGMVNELESAFATAGEEHKDKIQQNQRSVQRRIQGLEQRERGHQATLKSKEGFDRSLAQFKGEIYQQYQQSITKL